MLGLQFMTLEDWMTCEQVRARMAQSDTRLKLSALLT